MPQVTVYVRKKDMDAWIKLPNKAEAVRAMLHGQKLDAVKVVESFSEKIASRPSVTISSSDVPQTIDNPGQLKQVLKEDLKDYRTCKHGMDPAFCKHAKPGKECK